ncbi:serine/threonine protein kinase (Kcc4), putative [Cordyceps militaris CM01]|uniref:non-specific serine/threonine protein kinase n=1 Tax=Cordyceps militaris (strain CM01) TaxID=983644 RepID=G3J8X6_CORMM|nr:serine/threonine protein kinase (Kcc4), putative [Cordyceps militaris CM01]EGX94859.1 serine/threonine protein kinase (Kcc4), putative [Cordyceps militaris CM01]
MIIRASTTPYLGQSMGSQEFHSRAAPRARPYEPPLKVWHAQDLPSCHQPTAPCRTLLTIAATPNFSYTHPNEKEMAEAVVSAARSPLAEAAYRINSPIVPTELPPNKHRNQRNEYQTANEAVAHHHVQSPTAHSVAPDARVSALMNEHQATEEDKRMSQASYASTSSSRSKRNYKTHIGPWQLGRTLGKGSSARVRLCRHNLTNQLAAVKIVNRRMAYLVQDSSLAALSKWDSHLPEPSDGHSRVPMAIEREVAILKLIEHPNIMKLYDIWENRSEIYLILEYIDQGDLFTFINTKGRLSEQVAIFFFRQMISAISYCHSFNVCHRDLKPENILITADLQIKIADFGMAALHQTATHHLATACGSPHYAAPELLKNRQYRGDKADIWSMGVILYAMLSATLPFDDPDLRVMMGKTKKGVYEMPKHISPEAEDLIRRMLQVNPERRINLQDIWNHPLVQKYSYQDDFGDLTSQMLGKGFKYDPVPRADIDPQLLRQLRSMWHMFNEQDLAHKLTCEQPNDQKAFYWLLHDYRDKQLEDFKPELAHSMSDYHHMKPSIWKKRVSTCQFSQPRANGHGRSISRFTVISNAAEGDNATVVSYDPYRASGKLQQSDSKVGHAKVIVHRDSASSPAAQARARTKGSMTSLNSRQGTPSRTGPSLRHKRAVDFSHMRKRSNSTSNVQSSGRRPGTAGSSIQEEISPVQRVRSVIPAVPKVPTVYKRPQSDTPLVVKNASALFRDELRNFSNDIARNCDEAFRSSMIDDESVMSEGDKKNRDSTPFSFNAESPSAATEATEFSSRSWQHRPLPPLPAEDGALSDATTAADSRPGSGEGYGSGGEYIIDCIAQRAVAVSIPRQVDRRSVSAPASNPNGKKTTVLPSINENFGTNNIANDKSRIVSAPQATSKQMNGSTGDLQYLNNTENTIRMVVDSPVGQVGSRAVEVPIVKRKLTKEELGRKLHLHIAYNADRAVESGPHSGGDEVQNGGGVRKMRSWFRRVSRTDSEHETSLESQRSPAISNSSQEPQSATTDTSSKKRAFSFPFWRNSRTQEQDTAMDGEHVENDRPLSTASQARRKSSAVATVKSSESGTQRSIEIKQNWLTRLFRVKPATSYVCMNLSRRKARQEVALLLREWRRYGIRDMQVDKQRNIIFARVAAKNYLNIKEVAIAAEVVTVIEHGKRQPLSIVRFTQERGAASSFHRVVDTIRIVFDDRNLVVTDRNKQKMMIRTLTSGN